MIYFYVGQRVSLDDTFETLLNFFTELPCIDWLLPTPPKLVKFSVLLAGVSNRMSLVLFTV